MFWVGEEEEEKVIFLIFRLKIEGVGVSVVIIFVLKRVVFFFVDLFKEMFLCIIEFVLRSKEEKSCCEMKFIVLKFFRE